MKLIDAIINKWFCLHEWDVDVLESYDPYSWSQKPESVIKIYTCKKCGKFKKIKV